MNKAYSVKFTNADGEVVTRGFDTEKQVRGYTLALSEQGIKFEITHYVGRAFTDWAKGIVNDGIFGS